MEVIFNGVYGYEENFLTRYSLIAPYENQVFLFSTFINVNIILKTVSLKRFNYIRKSLLV